MALPQAGYMVENKDQMPNKGKAVPKISEEEFSGHVAQFKKNSGISYPFSIGTKEQFESYSVQGIPTLAVIDKSGKVAMIVVGASPANEAMLHALVANLLEAKA